MRTNRGFELNKFYSRIYKKYDLINRLFTFGLDRRWRNITGKKCLEKSPNDILDLCCGTGDLAITLAQQNSTTLKITGYDFNKQMLEIANQKKLIRKLLNLNFIEGDAANLPFPGNHFDAITIGFGFRNLTFNNPNQSKHLTEIYRVIKPGGYLYILESGVPSNFLIRIFYTIYLYLILVPLGGILSGDIKAYWYLAHSSSKFFSNHQVEIMLKQRGFKTFNTKKFLFGSTNLFIIGK